MSGVIPADPFDLVGTLIERKYRVDGVVAQGGFGVVYRGHHLALDTPLAIKVLRPSRELDADGWSDLLAQFLEEARTLAKLRHPSIVAVLDAGVMDLGEHPTVPWMALEWLEGATLQADLATRRGGLGRTPEECLALLRPVLEGIAHAHEAGIVHRDLKPSNIMLVTTLSGVEARVLDFGIAKMVDPEATFDTSTGETRTESRVSSFTAAFAAPEQLSRARTGPWTDVYALALLLTEMLTDRPPLPLDDANEHYRAVFAEGRPSPATLGIDVGAWEEVLVRALAVRSLDRPRNARALLAELDAALPGAKHVALVAGGSARVTDHGGGDSATDPRATTADATDGAAALAGTAPRRRALVRSNGGRAALGIAAAAIVASSVWIGRVALRAAPRAAVSAAPSSGRTCTNASCAAELGRLAVCKHDTGTCTALESEDCAVHVDPRDPLRDDTVWIGAMFARTGPKAAIDGVWNHHAIELARRDFAQTLGGLEGGRARPLAVLECDDAVDPHRAATHLVDDVGVPAVIGFQSGVEAMDLASAVFLPRGVLVLAATNTNPMLTALPQPRGGPRLIYRTTYSTASAAAAIGRFVSDYVEPSLRASIVPNGERVRIASLRAPAAAGADVGDALRDALRFNAKTALANGDDYREIPYDLKAAAADPALEDVAVRLLAFEPHVIVFAEGRGFARGVVAPVERRWRSGTPRPRWIAVSELFGDLVDVVGKESSARGRFFGVTPVSETAANARFVTHYRESFSEPVTRADSPNSTYDAFYLLAFASYAIAPSEPVTGAGLARAFERLVPPGKAIEVGLPGIFDAYSTLAGGGRVDVTGATGSLDFDLARGEAPFDESILCVGLDDRGRKVGAPSGLVYVAASQKLEGELHCR